MKRPDSPSLFIGLAIVGTVVLLWLIFGAFGDHGHSHSRFTFETVSKLHVHQTYSDVVGILGEPDIVTMEQDQGNPTQIWATWGSVEYYVAPPHSNAVHRLDFH